jgi:hypothetical protein
MGFLSQKIGGRVGRHLAIYIYIYILICIYIFDQTLVGRSTKLYVKNSFFFNAQNKELKGFDLGSPTRKPRALTTCASGVVYNAKGAFFLKGGWMFEGA